MSEKTFDQFLNDVLIPYFKNNKYYNADELYKIIAVKKNIFEQSLDSEQKEEFLELWKLSERYCDIVKQDSFSDGLLKGLTWNEKNM